MKWKVRRAWYRWKFRAVRREARAVRVDRPMDGPTVHRAWSQGGHLNTATGQWSQVVLSRAGQYGWRWGYKRDELPYEPVMYKPAGLGPQPEGTSL